MMRHGFTFEAPPMPAPPAPPEVGEGEVGELSDADLMRPIIEVWHARVDWACRLVVAWGRLRHPIDFLRDRPSRGRLHADWHYTIAGDKLELYRAGNRSGVVFHLQQQQPDANLLHELMIKLVNEGAVDLTVYGPLIDDRDRWYRVCLELLGTPRHPYLPPMPGMPAE